MKTRTQGKRGAKVVDSPSNETSSPKDIVCDINPPVLLVLPKDLSSDARIVTLPDPATDIAGRYVICPDRGPLEFTRIASSKECPTSWLLAPVDVTGSIDSKDSKRGIDNVDKTDKDISIPRVNDDESDRSSKGYCMDNSDLHIATPIDPIFLLLPILIPTDDAQQMYLSLEDHLDAWSTRTGAPASLLTSAANTALLITRLKSICETVEAGDELMFRYSETRTAQELFMMAERVVASGLPASLEAKYVQEALCAPSLLVLQGENEPESDSNSTGHPSSTDKNKAIVENLLRLRTALDYILDSYLQPTLRTRFREYFLTSSICDFSPLTTHLATLEAQRREGQALRSISNNMSRKREHDEEAEELRAEKRRKKEAEELKKKSASRGAKQLAKIDTSGMKKMSSFFGKKPETA